MKIRTKLLLSYAVIMILISAVLSISYSISKETIESNVTENSINSLRVISQQMDAEIQYVTNLWDMIYNSSNVNYYINRMRLEEDVYQNHYYYVQLHHILGEYTSSFLQNDKQYELIVCTSSDELAYYSWSRIPPDSAAILASEYLPKPKEAFTAEVHASYNPTTPELTCLYLYNTFTNVYNHAIDYHIIVGIPEMDIAQYYEALTQEGTRVSLVDGSGRQILGDLEEEELAVLMEHLPDRDAGVVSGKTSGQEYINIYSSLPSAGWYIIQSTPTSVILADLNIWNRIIWIGMLVLLGSVIAVSAFMNRSIVRPVQILYQDMQQVKQGIMDIPPKNQEDRSELGALSRQFYEMVERTSLLKQQALKDEQQKHMLELDALQTQINPHFMHNTINSIKMLIRLKQYEKANTSLTSLREILKNTLGKSGHTTELEKEVDILRSYVYIHQIRYAEFQFTVSLPEHLRRKQILRFILQPFVENAILHAYREIDAGVCIQVSFYDSLREGALYITIQDNGVGMDENQIQEILTGDRTGSHLTGIGIGNVINRIRLNYGSDYYVGFDSSPGHGTKVTIKLPLIGGGKDESGKENDKDPICG